MICKRNVPVASLKAATQGPHKRPLGMFRGVITYTDDCFAPLTELELREWGLQVAPRAVIADTCVAIWLMTEPERLSDLVRDLVEDSSVRVFVSAVTVVEIGIKYSAGKLRLPKPPKQAIPELCRAMLLDQMPFDHLAAFFMAELPELHRDPFDRMIICQAMESRLPILTPDVAFRDYDVRVIW